MRKIILLLPVMAASIFGTMAQQAYESIKMPQMMPPSPEAFQLGSYGTVPVGLFTGTINFSIPLYEVKTRNLSVPITLNYSSNGIKVDMPSSRVGTDWLMQAGGVINRTVYGKEDFVWPRPALPSSFTTLSTPLRDYLDAIAAGDDSQADMYSFNFNGFSGSFYFTRTGEIVTVPYQPNLRIVQNTSTPTAWHFKVITPDGVSYIFGGTGAVEKSKTQSGGSGCPNTNYPFIENAWYLKKIVHPFGDSIQFNYNSVYYSHIANFSQSIEKKYPVTQFQLSCTPADPYQPVYIIDPPDDSWSSCYTTITNDGCILSSITFPDGYVRFSNAVRFDLPGDSSLSAISVYARNQAAPVKVIDLDQAYATADLSFQNSVVSANGGSVRLFLFAVKELYPGNTTPGKSHIFEYYDTANLAPRLSMAQDHFGYFNGANNSWFFPTTSDYNNLFNGYGGDRAPNFTFASRGLLKKITYPTGGYTEIFYEQNLLKADRVNYPTEGQTVVNGHLDVGGVRVAKTVNSDGVTNKPETRRFLYNYVNDPTQSSGDLAFRPVYISDKIVHKLCEPMMNGDGCQFMHYPMKVVHSNSIYPLYAASNGTVVYNEVRESLGENFENGGILHRYLTEGNPLPQVLHGNLIPSGNTENTGVLNGLEKETLYYSVVGGNTIKRREIKNTYRVLDGLSSSSTIFKIDTGILVNRIGSKCQGQQMTQQDLDLHDINRYLTFSSFIYNDTSFVYEFDSKGQNPVATIKITRFDNLQNLQKTSEKTFASNGDSIVTEYKYAYDFKSLGNVYQKMYDANFSAAVIETKVKKQATTLNVIKTNYADWFSDSKILVPQTVEFTHTSFSPEVRLQYHNYSTKGELLEVAYKDDAKKSYVWNLTAAYPLAEASNAKSTDIAYTSFEEDGAGNWTFSGTPLAESAITGKRTYKLSAGNITKSGLGNTSTYIVSYWSKNGAQSVNGSSSATGSFTVGSWQYWVHKIVNPSGGTITISGSGTIDELRLYPERAQMKSFVYNPLVGITSACDESGRLSFYEYDEFQRLILIRDQDKRIIKKICYNYAGQPENCTIYYNVQKSGVFTRSNCSPGYVGSQVTYIVPAGTHSSTESQGKADTSAINDVNANGQAYANANGSCAIATIYVNIEYTDWYYDLYDTYATVLIKFYSDPNHNNPISVSNLSVNYQRIRYPCIGGSSTTNYNINCTGTEVSLGVQTIARDDGIHCFSYDFLITAGTGYVVNN